jgi:hypothetical protein
MSGLEIEEVIKNDLQRKANYPTPNHLADSLIYFVKRNFLFVTDAITNINSIVENIQSVTVQRQSNDTPSSKRNIQIMNSRSAKENNSADGKKKYENGKVSNANDKPFIPEK